MHAIRQCVKALVKLPHYSAKERISAVAKTVEDARKLKTGFEYVTDVEEVKIFRKKRQDDTWRGSLGA